MNQKHIFAAVAVIVVLIAAFLLFNQGQDNNDLASNTNTTNTADSTENVNSDNTNTVDNSNANVPANTTTPPPATGEPTVPQDPDIAVFEIVYNGTSFNPSQLTIKNGDVVIFKNESGKSFWPASGPHPEHTNYPEFDPKKAIASGQDWQFKFTKSGTWPFHDHLNSTVFGKITVQ